MVQSTSSSSAMVGGRFEIEREVGRGGVGIVYRALDRETGQQVALKLIALAGLDASEEERFFREGRLLEELEHPHIVKFVACGAHDNAPYVAMEWLEGEDLAARQRRAPLGLAPALEVARQVALALDAAHRAGIVHRDVKPSNVFLLASGTDELPSAKLVDFGVALNDDARLTRTGVVVGTPAYMAPEQAKAEGAPDRRADIYSLGATLFELLAGRPPHFGPTAIATLAKLVTTEAPRLSEIVAEVPPALDRLITGMLESDPERRPASAWEVAEALSSIAADARTRQLSLPRGAPPTPAADTSQGTRLVTSIVALQLGERRFELVRDLRARGADAVAIGKDALVAHFGARRAIGGEATRALELARWIAESGGKVGVATGRSKVDLTRPVGDVVDRAASLAHAAAVAEVLADTTTAELSRATFQFQPRSERSAVVVGPKVTGKRERFSESALFVGREAELAQVLAAFERCVDDSTPVVATVSGPPGIGKSRLGREIIARLAEQTPPPRVVAVQSEPFGQGHALGTAADVVRALLGDTAGPNVGNEILARLIADEPLPEGQGTRGARDELWLAMTDVVVQAASRGPCVIVLEDLQWADPESVAWIGHMLARTAGLPLLALALVRPEFFHDKGLGARFEGRDHLRIALRPISRRSSRAIASALLGDKAQADALERIAEQSAGSPLFARELARLAALGQEAKFGPTLEATIQVSLDALDGSCRDAVAKLSVFGLSGWDTGLEVLGAASPAAALHQLCASELLFERPQSRFSSTREWAFKHSLVRDVAYALLGDAQKAALHALAGAWLAQQGEDAATVAKHLELGGRGSEAAVHWERAARRALSTNALSDAVQMAETALAHALDPPTAFARALLLDEAYSRLDPRAADRETAVQALAHAAFDDASRLRADGARARFDHARGIGIDLKGRLFAVREGAKKQGLVDEEMRCTAILAMRAAFEGELEVAEREANHLFELARVPKQEAAAVDAWQCLAVVHQTRGALVLALEARRAAATAASQAGLKEREAMLKVNLGFALTTIGARDEAKTAILAGLEVAHAIGSIGAIRHGRMNLLGWAATFGSDPALSPELAEARAEADATSSGAWIQPDRATLGLLFYRGLEWLHSAEPGAPARARELLHAAASAYRSTENLDLLPVALALWAEAERKTGSRGQALTLAEEAAGLVEQGAPSLLNESPIFLALHGAHVEAGNQAAATDAVRRGMVPLVRRLKGLSGSSYARAFLTALADNERLLRLGLEEGLLPPEVPAAFAEGSI